MTTMAATNMTIPFDTLAYAKKLKSAGVSDGAAEIQAEALAEVVNDRLATKKDLQELQIATQRDLKELELRLTYKLTLRLGSMIAAGIAILSVLIRIH